MDATSFVVLDEADKLLQMGFEAQVRQILGRIRRPDRQTLLLSATMGRRVEQVAREWLSARNAVRIAVGRTGAASMHVAQHVLVLPHAAAKERFVVEMLPVWRPLGRTLVFCATREGCERLAEAVRRAQPRPQRDKDEMRRSSKWNGWKRSTATSTSRTARRRCVPLSKERFRY